MVWWYGMVEDYEEAKGTVHHCHHGDNVHDKCLKYEIVRGLSSSSTSSSSSTKALRCWLAGGAENFLGHWVDRQLLAPPWACVIAMIV